MTKTPINVLSLFDGISCGQLALQRAGIPVNQYFASEIDKHAIKVTQHNFPNTIQLGSVVDVKAEYLPKIDLICAGSPCFVAGTPVLTNKGYKSIEDVKVSDEVLSHKGNWKNVLKIGGKLNCPIISLCAKGSLPIQTTKEHPFFTRAKSVVWENNVRRYKISFAAPEWTEAANIKKGDLIGFPRMKDSHNELYELSDDELFVLGRYIADGHTRKDYRVSEGRPNDRNWQLILSIGKGKEFATSCNHSFYPHTKSVSRMVFSSKKLVKLAENYCGRGAENKHIGPSFLALPKDKLIIVLDGLMSGDGSARKNEFRLTTVSYKLLLSMQMAVVKCYGTSGCLMKTIRPKTTIIEGRTVNQKDTYSISFRKADSFDLCDDNYVWSYVKSVAEDFSKQDVFNLEIQDDNSYTVQNISVHNCQGFSLAGKQLNFEDPRSKLFFEFVRLLKECAPKYFLLENVKMKKEYENVITETLGVAPIKINSALVSAQNRERLYWTNIPDVKQPEDKGILLKDILEFSVGENSVKNSPDQISTAGNRGKGNRVYVYPRGTNDGGLKHYNGKSPCITTSNWEHNIFAAQRIESNLEKLLETSKYKDSFQWRYDKKGRVLVMRPDGLKIQRIGRVANENTKTEIITCLTQPHLDNGLLIRKITPVEAERLQTVPDNYTSCISDNKRYHALGNGWTVDVIAHILSGIQ